VLDARSQWRTHFAVAFGFTPTISASGGACGKNLNQCRLNSPPSRGDGRCWSWPATPNAPSGILSRSTTQRGKRSGHKSWPSYVRGSRIGSPARPNRQSVLLISGEMQQRSGSNSIGSITWT
jgi:hypothetical protein